MNNPDNCRSAPHRKQQTENMKRNLELLKHSEPNNQCLHKNSMDNFKEANALLPKGQDELETPTKKMKVMCEMKVAPEETRVKQLITDSASKTSTQHAHEANAQQEKDDLNVLKVKRSDKSEHSSIDIGNAHDSESAMKDERDLQDPMTTSYSNSETKAKAPQAVTGESTKEMQPTDGDYDYQSKPDVSSCAAVANIQSGTSEMTSNNSLEETPVCETHNTYFKNKTTKNKQLKKDNHQSSAQIRGYSGLRNQGATCYLNAVLQTLFMTQEFRNAVTDLNVRKTQKKSVSLELQKLFRRLASNTGIATTNGVTKALDIRNVCAQQDAAEYYQKILSMVEPEPAKIFQGKKKHSTTCLHGNHKSIDEVNSFFSLPIAMESDQNKINVTESFNAQFKVMLMDGEDQLYCENCKRMTDMKMSCTISELPDVLTLHLQRFYLDYNYMSYVKNNCHVKIPLQLPAQEESGVHHVFKLYAVVNHVGSLSGGHYYADIKSFDDQQWYQFNDSMVHKIQKLDELDVRRLQNHFISDKACLLFFRKSSTQHAHEANAQQEKDDLNVLKVKRSDKSEHSSIDVGNAHDSESAMKDERDLQDPMSTSYSNSETKAKPLQAVTGESTKEMQPTDGDYDYQSKPNGLSGVMVFQSSESELNNESKRENEDQDLHQHLNTCDFNSETEAIPSEPMTEESTPNIEVKSIHADYDYQSKPDVSSCAAVANIQSGTSEITSNNSLEETPVCETHDTYFKNKTTKNKQPKKDNHQSSAQIRGITGSTFFKVSYSERPEQRTQRAISWPVENNVEHQPSRRDSECKSTLNNTNIQILKNCEDAVNLPQQHTEYITIDIENNYDSQSTVKDEQDLQGDLKNSDFNTITVAKPPQSVTDESTPDIEMQSTDADYDYQSKPTILSGVMVCQSSESELYNESNRGKEEQDLQGDLKNSDFNAEAKAKPSQTRTDEPTKDIEIKSTDADYDYEPALNINFSGVCVSFKQERQRTPSETHETANNESDSDDEAGAQNSSLLNETTISRRKIPPWVFFLIGLFLLCLVFIFVFIFTSI